MAGKRRNVKQRSSTCSLTPSTQVEVSTVIPISRRHGSHSWRHFAIASVLWTMRLLSNVAALVLGVYTALLLVPLSLLESPGNLQVESKLQLPLTKTPLRTKPVIKQRPIPRFPDYGTPEYSHQCGWEAYDTTKERNCTFFVRPDPLLGEGISLWVTLIAQAHQMAQLANCDLVFDYGENMNVSSVLIPTISWNWTVPRDFVCRYPCFPWHPLNAERDPSLADFAEAIIDWYLIGEADLVIMDQNSVSFGGTAALRTARTVFDASRTHPWSKGKCQKAVPIHRGRDTHNAQ